MSVSGLKFYTVNKDWSLLQALCVCNLFSHSCISSFFHFFYSVFTYAIILILVSKQWLVSFWLTDRYLKIISMIPSLWQLNDNEFLLEKTVVSLAANRKELFVTTTDEISLWKFNWISPVKQPVFFATIFHSIFYLHLWLT